jgi:predicted PurR-regulated permease PerM
MDRIEISHRTIIFTVLLLIGLWLLYQVINVLLLLLISFIFMTALNPLVTRLERWRFPRQLAIFVSYVVVIGLVAFIIGSIVPPLIEQTSVLTRNLALPWAELGLLKLDPSNVNNQLELLSRNLVGALNLVLGAASNILAIFTIGVMTFYLLMERRNLDDYLEVLFGNGDSSKRAQQFVNNLERKLGGWVRGQLALMFIIGIMSYIGLRLLGVSFALPLAMVAGLLEFIPNIGPTVAAVPAIIVAFTISPALALGVAFLYIAIQQLENNLIVPVVMKKAAGVHPLVTITALMIGFTLGGIGGAVLAVPVFLLTEVIVHDLYAHRKD